MRLKKTTINLTVGISTLVITTLLSFVLSKVFITNLGIEHNGLNGIFNNIIAILSITELGIAGSINFALYKPIFDKDYEKIASLMNFFKKTYRIIGILILIFSLFVTTFIPILIKDSNFNHGYIRLVFMIFAINSSISYFYSYNRSLFYANQENYYVTIIDFIFKTLKTFMQLYLLIKFQNYVLFLSINIIFTFLNNITINFLAKRIHSEIVIGSNELDKTSKKEIFAYVKNLSIVQIMSTFINFTDNIIISSLIGISTVGLFINYNMIITQLNAVINTIFHGIGASLGNLLAENQKNRTNAVLYNLEYLGFFISSFCTICLTFLTQPFISNIWLGRQYLLSLPFLIIIITNLYLSIQRQLINYYLRMSGHFKEVVFPIIIEAIVNLIVSIILALAIGLIGVVIGTLISSIIGYILTSVQYNKYIEQKNSVYWSRQLKFLITTLINIFIINLIISNIVITNSILNFIALGFICVIISGITILFFILRNDRLDIYKNILNKLIKKSKYEPN